MANTYRICRWSETFETADSRKHKTLQWVSLPIDRQSNGYQSMIDHFADDAPAIYGAWCALVGIAAGCPQRGVLACSRGNGLTTQRIARMAHMPEDVFKRLFDWASRENVGWLEVLDGEANTSIDSQSIDDRTAIELPNTTQPNPTRKSAAKSPPPFPDWFESFWMAYPANANGRKRGKRKTFDIATKIPDGDYPLLVKAAKNYAADADEFVRDPERFVKDDFWRDYAGDKFTPGHLPKPKAAPKLTADQARFKLVKSGRSEARDWSDDECVRQVAKSMAVTS